MSSVPKMTAFWPNLMADVPLFSKSPLKAYFVESNRVLIVPMIISINLKVLRLCNSLSSLARSKYFQCLSSVLLF